MRNLKSGVTWTTVSTIVLAFSGILKFSILARLLDKDDFGLMAIVTFLIGFSNLFMDLGLSTAIVHKQKISKAEYSSLYWFNVFSGIGLYILLLVVSPLVAMFYQQPELKILIPIACTVVIITSIGRQFKTVAQKELNFKFISIAEIVSSSSSVLVGIVFAYLDYGVYSLVFASVWQHLVMNSFFLVLGLSLHRPIFHFVFSEIRSFLSIGIYQAGGQIINFFNRDIDILIIGKFYNAEILGGYSLAKQLVFRPFQIIGPIINKIALPVLAKLQRSKSKFKEQFLIIVRIASKAYFCSYLLLGFFSDFFLLLFYGSSYMDLSHLVKILSIFMLIRSIVSVNGNVLAATGRTKIGFVWNILMSLVIPIFVYAGSLISIEFSAYSLLGAMVILFVPNWFVIIRTVLQISLKEYLGSIFRIDRKDLRFLKLN